MTQKCYGTSTRTGSSNLFTVMLLFAPIYCILLTSKYTGAALAYITRFHDALHRTYSNEREAKATTDKK